MNIHNKITLKEIRRNLRQESTLAERLFWEKIRNRKINNLKFTRQHSIGNYIVDFYCASKRLIIEVDGEVHLNKEQKEKDKARDTNLKEIGFIILRFSNNKILHNFVRVQKIIESI